MADPFSFTQVTGSPADYATYTQVAEAMPDVTLGATYQAAITTLITRASRLIDSFLIREPGAFYVTADTTRYYDGTGDELIGIDEIAAAPYQCCRSRDRGDNLHDLGGDGLYLLAI